VGPVAPERVKSFQVKYFEANESAQVTGTSADFRDVRGLEIAQGRFFTPEEGRLALRVCVLGSEIAYNLFKGAPALGETIRIKNAPYRVIGVLVEKGRAGFASLDDQIFVPIDTFFRRLSPGPYVRMISLKALSPGLVDEAIQEVQELMDHRHKPS